MTLALAERGANIGRSMLMAWRDTNTTIQLSAIQPGAVFQLLDRPSVDPEFGLQSSWPR